MTHYWRNGYHAALEADVAAAEFDKLIGKHGDLTPDIVVDAARSKRNKLHVAFEWDDPKAADEHRKAQARSMMASLIEYDEAEKSVPAHRMLEHVHVDKGPVYRRTVDVLAEQETREQVLARAAREAESWAKRYSSYMALAEAQDTIARAFLKATESA